jgi:small subunit ribosomal protein S20
MANIKANKKSIRQTAKRAASNRIVRTRLKSVIKELNAAPTKDKGSLVASTLDKAVKKGVIHRNKANRLKSAIAKKLAKK